MRFVHLIFFALFIFCFESKAFAYQPWQIVGGRYVSFQLPASELPPKSETLREAAWRAALGQPNPKCDLASKIITHVFTRIVDANNLREYIAHGPGLGLILTVQCSADLFAGLPVPDRQPHAIGPYVVMNVHLVDFLNSEDEIAFLIGHEISHVILGHTRADSFRVDGLSIPLPRGEGRTQQQESEADIYGALMAANAGYNPYAARAALDGVFSRYGLGLLRFENVIDTYLGDGHGTDLQRQMRIDDQIRSLNLPVGYKSPHPSAEFLAARAQLSN